MLEFSSAVLPVPSPYSLIVNVCVCVSRYYVGIALSCVLLLVVAFIYLGLCFGACGETAGENGGLCNRSTGACLLLMYA